MYDISVVIPVFNGPEKLKQAVNSVLSCNTSFLYEIIIVNDSSTDEAIVHYGNEIIKQHDNIKFVTQKNAGQGAARNTGIKQSSSRYILTLDSDNLITSNFIEDGIAFLDKNHDVDMVYTNYLKFTDNNVPENGELVNVPEFCTQKLIIENTIDNCSIFRKKMWDTIGGYDEHQKLRGIEDWDFWLHAITTGHQLKKLAIVGYYYRLSASSSSMAFNSDKSNINFVLEYLDNKYPALMDRSYVHHYFLSNVKKSKYLLLLRILLDLFFPSISNWLYKKNKIRKYIF